MIYLTQDFLQWAQHNLWQENKQKRKVLKIKKQARAELGQAQLKLELDLSFT